MEELELEELVFEGRELVNSKKEVVTVVPVGYPRSTYLKNDKRTSFIEALNKSLKFQDREAKYYLKGPTKTWTEEISRLEDRRYYRCSFQLYRDKD